MKKLLYLLLFISAFCRAQSFRLTVPDSLRSKIKIRFEGNDTLSEYDVIVDCGLIKYGERPLYTFFLSPKKELMILTWVGWGEPCFAPKYGNESIKPGKSELFTYQFIGPRPGRFDKTATIQSNLGRIYIHFKGEEEIPQKAEGQGK
jgi:hypothetical protein